MSETCEDSLHNTVFNHKWCLPNTKKSFCCCFSRWPPLSCGVVDNTFGCGGESPSSSPGRGNTWEYRNVLFWVKFLENFGEINFSVQFHDFRAGFTDPQRWVLVSRFFESVEPRKHSQFCSEVRLIYVSFQDYLFYDSVHKHKNHRFLRHVSNGFCFFPPGLFVLLFFKLVYCASDISWQ